VIYLKKSVEGDVLSVKKFEGAYQVASIKYHDFEDGICHNVDTAYNRLTRSALYWTTLSSASSQRGLRKKNENPLFPP